MGFSSCRALVALIAQAKRCANAQGRSVSERVAKYFFRLSPPLTGRNRLRAVSFLDLRGVRLYSPAKWIAAQPHSKAPAQ